MISKRTVTIACPLCGVLFEPSITHTNICTNCLVGQQDITENISRHEYIQFCSYCRRYNRPPWVLCERESQDLLSLCLKKFKGLNDVKLISAAFVFTEPSSKVIRIKVTIQKELINFTQLQQDLILEVKEEWKQCIDCRKEFTPHTWGAQIQLRQRVDHKKTFYFLEQQILKHHMDEKILKVESVEGGLDLFFQSQQQAKQMLDFISSMLPVKIKHSTELISQDLKNNTSHTKHAYSVEIPIICKDNLVVLPPKLASQLGGIGRLQVCYKISTIIHLIDPITMKCSELSSERFFQYEVQIKVMEIKREGVEFTVLDVEMIKNQNLNESYISSISNNFLNRIAKVEVMNDSEYQTYSVKSHLGALLRVGQTVIGFDLNKMVQNVDELPNRPDIILISIKREKAKKPLKLKRMKIENADKKSKQKQAAKQLDKDDEDFEEFLGDVQNDPELQSIVVSEQIANQPEVQEQIQSS